MFSVELFVIKCPEPAPVPPAAPLPRLVSLRLTPSQPCSYRSEDCYVNIKCVHLWLEAFVNFFLLSCNILGYFRACQE